MVSVHADLDRANRVLKMLSCINRTIVRAESPDGLYQEACRIVRRRPGREDCLGHLVHGPGGSWRFRYDLAAGAPDETGNHFENQRFEPDEYISVREADGLNVYRVASVVPL